MNVLPVPCELSVMVVILVYFRSRCIKSPTAENAYVAVRVTLLLSLVWMFELERPLVFDWVISELTCIISSSCQCHKYWLHNMYMYIHMYMLRMYLHVL